MTSFCSHFNQRRCGSCQWIESAYPSQLERKEKTIREALAFLGSVPLEKSVGSPTEGFRNRAKMTVTGALENPVIGLQGESDLDEGRELLDCPIHHPKLNEMLALLPELIRDYRLSPYKIRERRGELKGLIAFYSPLSDQMYLRFVVRSKESVARIKKLVPILQEKFPALACISANIQPIPHAILEGPEEIILTERKYIDHQLGPIRLKLAPQAFVQTNVTVATELYRTAARWVAEIHPARMLELFCGQGAFSFFSAESADQLLGIELNPDAVQAANETAREMRLNHLEFKAADAGKVAAEIEEFAPDLILANPPRRGLGESLALIERYAPPRFLYSSCSIETLASDLKKLASLYRLNRARLFDLFPHTAHFETLVWLERIR